MASQYGSGQWTRTVDNARDGTQSTSSQSPLGIVWGRWPDVRAIAVIWTNIWGVRRKKLEFADKEL